METVISVKITPRMPKNEIYGILENGTIKVRLTAPPVDGKANQALIVFLADILGITGSNIRIISGHTSRTKMISISGISKKGIDEILKNSLKTK